MTVRSSVSLSTLLLMLTAAYAQAQQIGETETRRFFSCRTIVTWTAPQGTQVSYLGAGSKAYLWAPGNETVQSGNWRIDPRATSGRSGIPYLAVCVQYGASTQWDCRPAELLERITMDHADGDVFGLAGRSAVPFALARDRTNIAMLQQRLPAPAAAQAQTAAKCE